MLKVGQVWKDRSGDDVEIVKKDKNNIYPFLGSNGIFYTEKGSLFKAEENCYYDLIELIKDVSGPQEITWDDYPIKYECGEPTESLKELITTPTHTEMTTEEYFDFIDKTNEMMVKLVRGKNADYTGGESPFANFKASEKFGVDPIVGLAVRMGDKMQRLQSYCKRGKLEVEGEGITEIAYDFIGYSWLLLGLVEERKRNATKI